MTIILIIAAALIFGYCLGLAKGNHAGRESVFDHVRGTGRCFSPTEVVVGQVTSWADYENTQAKIKGTVDGIAVESRSANSKHEAKTVISGTEGYKHPFLNRDTDA